MPELLQAVLDRSGDARGLRGRADDRGARPHREPRGVRRRRARVPAEHAGRDALRLPAGDLALLGPGRAHGREQRHADDDPQREGARVPRRLPRRLRGGDLPQRPLDRGAGDRGGAAPVLRQPDAREGAADADARVLARCSGAGRRTTCRPASSTSCPTGTSSASGCAPRRGGTTARRRRRATSSRSRTCPRSRPATPSATARSARASSRAWRPAALVTVRFANDGSERQADARLRAVGEDRRMSVDIRQPATPEELRAAMEAAESAFGATVDDDDWERESKVLPLERTLAAYDGDRPVGLAGAYQFDLSIPGGSLPCAGVTWVGVLQSHRRRGILRDFMRRQLEDARGWGEPIAALWASESLIYGRFGYGLAVPSLSMKADRSRFALRDDTGPHGTRAARDGRRGVRALPAGLRAHPRDAARACSRAPSTGGERTSSPTRRAGAAVRASSSTRRSSSTARSPAMPSTASRASGRTACRRARFASSRPSRRPRAPSWSSGASSSASTSRPGSTASTSTRRARCRSTSATRGRSASAGRTASGCGSSTSMPRCALARTPTASRSCSRSATSSARGTPAATGWERAPAGRRTTPDLALDVADLACLYLGAFDVHLAGARRASAGAA